MKDLSGEIRSQVSLFFEPIRVHQTQSMITWIFSEGSDKAFFAVHVLNSAS